MNKDILKEVIKHIVGKYEELVDIISKKKPVNEFTIAKKLKLTPNQMRNILYRLLDGGIVSFIRKKDEKKGWYTYYWKIETRKALEYWLKHLYQKKKQIEEQIKRRETERYYICDTCNIELSESDALLYEFTCPECGEPFRLKDNKKLIRELNKKKNKVEEDIKIVEGEIEKEKKKREAEIEKEREREKEERRKRREERKKQKEKEERKLKKKKTKKSSKKSKTKSKKRVSSKKKTKKVSLKKKTKKSSKKKK